MSATVSLVEQLYIVPENGKAEIINGQVGRMSPTGSGPSRAAGKIYISLSFHEDQSNGSYAYSDNAGFLVSLPGRQSFSPDAA
jgi:Uma2 family endonuclease